MLTIRKKLTGNKTVKIKITRNKLGNLQKEDNEEDKTSVSKLTSLYEASTFI